MGQIKRGITSILDVKRGDTNINYIYRETTLIWQRGTPPVTPTLWETNGLNVVLGINITDGVYLTDGLNIKFK